MLPLPLSANHLTIPRLQSARSYQDGVLLYYHNGFDAEKPVKKRYQCIKSVQNTARIGSRSPSPSPLLTPHSIWKLRKDIVRDWPLALCDAKTVDLANDLVTSDVAYQDHSEENYQVHYNPQRRWLYLSDQQPSEMLVFRCADSWEDQVGPGEIIVLQTHLNERWYLTSMFQAYRIVPFHIPRVSLMKRLVKALKCEH